MMTLNNFMDTCRQAFILHLDFECCFDDVKVGYSDDIREKIRAAYGNDEITEIEYNTDINFLVVTMPVVLIDDTDK